MNSLSLNTSSLSLSSPPHSPSMLEPLLSDQGELKSLLSELDGTSNYFKTNPKIAESLNRYLAAINRSLPAAGSGGFPRLKVGVNSFVENFSAWCKLLAKEANDFQQSNCRGWQVKCDQLQIKLTKADIEPFSGKAGSYLLQLNDQKFKLTPLGLQIFCNILVEVQPLLEKCGIKDEERAVEMMLGCCKANNALFKGLRSIADFVVMYLSLMLVGMAGIAPGAAGVAALSTGVVLLVPSWLDLMDSVLSLCEPPESAFIPCMDQLYNKLFCRKTKMVHTTSVDPLKQLTQESHLASVLSNVVTSLAGVSQPGVAPTCPICLFEAKPQQIVNIYHVGTAIKHYCLDCLQKADSKRPKIDPTTNKRWDGILVYLNLAENSFKILANSSKMHEV